MTKPDDAPKPRTSRRQKRALAKQRKRADHKRRNAEKVENKERERQQWQAELQRKRQAWQAPPPMTDDDNLFNRASSRVHGYSSRMLRYVRLSISLRTSVAYALLLFRTFVPLALILSGLYLYTQVPSYDALRRQALEVLPASEVAGVETLLLEPGQPVDGFFVYEGWGLYFDADPFQIRLQYAEAYGTGTVQLLFSLENEWRMLTMIWLCLLGVLLFLSFTFLTRGRRINQKLYQPIIDITETAQQMNEKNLSARINVAGTQNELRDLAVVINEMLERIEAAYNRQKQFVSDASHELRTPIAVIQGYAGLLERWGKDNPDVRDEAIDAISGETRSMKELVENLLFLARHDKKTLSLTMEAFDSADMLRELVKETEIIVTEHRVVAGEIAACTLVADRSTVKQTVRVFVDNAIKYTPPGGSVSVSSRIEGDRLTITVTDTGCGIKKADLPRVFDRFFRADEARNAQMGGHGRGLAIARIIAVSHSGRIHVKSQPGVGSAFTLELPVRPDGAMS